MHSDAGQISRRCQILQMPYDVKPNRIVIFRCEADEFYAHALSSHFTYDSSKHVQGGTNFCDLELQSNFLAHLYIH